MKQVDTGIFLHRLSYSETSLITLFYTRGSGLKRYLFKGGKKKAHNLFPMAICEISTYGRTDSQLKSMTAVEASIPLHFQFDPIKSTIAFFVAEVLQKCVPEEEPDVHLFDFICAQVTRLETTDDCQLFPIEFLIDLTEALGVQPYCEERSARYFNLDEGTFEDIKRLDQRVEGGEAVELIKQRIMGEQMITSKRAVREEALEILLAYYSIHVPRFSDLSSYEIVREVLHA